MDIGDVNDIPTTRKKLPSMQELGAFDLDEPTASRPAAATVPCAAAPKASPPPPVPAAPPLEADDRIRDALARADAHTRKRLLRLIAGGRAVQQRGERSVPPGDAANAPLRMALQPPVRRQRADGPGAPAGHRAAGANAETARSDQPPPRNTRFDRLEQPLMQIDGNTDLLEALATPLDDDRRKESIRAQLEAVKNEATPPPTRAAGHKVLFPAYDPKQHGDDVRRPGRKVDGPVEGHFPAPRQPPRPGYRHADGRPMDEAETRVEEVLQEQRCEQTLEVLARDGVNGLLLSPRDLDAAVQDGVLDAETAALLWKTWSALRPVIHVIDDEVAAPAPALATVDVIKGGGLLSPKQDAAAPAAVPAPKATKPAPDAGQADGAEPAGDAEPLPPQTAVEHAPASPSGDGVAAAPICADPSVAPPGSAVQDRPAPLPAIRSSPAAAGSQDEHVMPPQTPAHETGSPSPRAVAIAMRWLGRAFVIGCVLGSSAQLGGWAWRYGVVWLAR